MKRIKSAGISILCALSVISCLAYLPTSVLASEEIHQAASEESAGQVVDEQNNADIDQADSSPNEEDSQETDNASANEEPSTLFVDGPVMVIQAEDIDEQTTPQNAWVYDSGIYYFYNDHGEKHKGWLVCRTTPLNKGNDLQRYWLDRTTGALAADRLISPEECGWWAFARPEGYVVRGAYSQDGKTYLANNDGVLENPGWLVTNAYYGKLDRYWIDADAHACVTGYSEDGWSHYTRPEGNVVRGAYTAPDGNVYLANNDGRLENPGWLVTNAYYGRLERYWIDADAHACVPGYSTDGWRHYTTKDGYVLRGYTTEGGVFRAANNDGLIYDGWIVTNQFGQGLQRYWQQDGQVVSDMLIQVSDSVWTYARPEGYVVRGKWTSPTTGFMYVADNDGKLAKSGWVVTDQYGDGLQRYYINENSHAIETGFFQAPIPGNDRKQGWFYNIENKCYVLRGSLATSNGVLLANNDGVLAENTHSEGWMTTSEYSGSERRYYLKNIDGHLYAQTGFFTANNKKYYGDTNNGYVLTGKLKTSTGMILSNKEGVLAESTQGSGWLVTNEYDGSHQRYYLEEKNGHLYTKTGFFTVDGKSYYGLEDTGYELRGKLNMSPGVLIANNDGVLAESAHKAGWMVTNEYDGSMQRYYLVESEGHLYAKTGMFTVSGKQYYGLADKGYVSRNETFVYDYYTYRSDNDGVLTQTSYKKQRDPYLAQVTWSNDTAYLSSMAQKVTDAKSSYADKAARTGNNYDGTDYAIVVDRELCRVTCFKRINGQLSAQKTFNCNLGRQEGGSYRTFAGFWKVEHKQICNWADKYFGKGYNDWSTCFIEAYVQTPNDDLRYVAGKGWEDCQSFHSSASTETGYDSAGCVRLLWDDAKWIYDNCPVGTWVIIF